MGAWAGNDPPDPAKGYVAGIDADLEGLPSRRLIDILALLGESGTVDIPGKKGGSMPVDFTGMGEADYQRQYADQLTQQLLDVQRQYGPQFVEQRLKELETADPAGAAMRRQLWSNIQDSTGSLTPRPENEQLQKLVMDELAKGGELDQDTSHRVSQGIIGGQVARGNYMGNAAATEEATGLAAAGEQMKAQRQQQALAFLTGGYSPEDAAQREQQQDLNTLGSFVAGETPTAQFSQLAGAQNGVVPFTTGTGTLPGVNANAGWQGVNNYFQNWNTTQQAQNNQVNPWVAGLGGALNGANVWGAMGGFRPAGQQGNAGTGEVEF